MLLTGISVMPPGIFHSVLTIEPSLMVGGHYLSHHLLRRTMMVNLMLKKNDLMSSNASHSDMLVALVVRHLNRLMQQWDSEARLLGSCLPVRRTNSDEKLIWPPTMTLESNGYAADWFSTLFLLPIVRTSSQDSDDDRLPNVDKIYQLTVRKALLFLQFWSKRTGSNNFGDSIRQRALEMMTTTDGRRESVIPFPQFWRPTEEDMSAV